MQQSLIMIGSTNISNQTHSVSGESCVKKGRREGTVDPGAMALEAPHAHPDHHSILRDDCFFDVVAGSYNAKTL